MGPGDDVLLKTSQNVYRVPPATAQQRDIEHWASELSFLPLRRARRRNVNNYARNCLPLLAIICERVRKSRWKMVRRIERETDPVRVGMSILNIFVVGNMGTTP